MKKLVTILDIDEVMDVLFRTALSLQEIYPSRYVESIYFDTPDFWLARSHLNGVQKRYKFRLRTYNSENKKYYELKQKHEQLTLKHRVQCDEVRGFWTGFNQTSLLVNSDSLKPVTKVFYKRRYFECQEYNCRITIDWNIGYCLADSLFHPGFVNSPVVIEVKSKDVNTKPDYLCREFGDYVSHSKYLSSLQTVGLISHLEQL